MKIKVMSRQTGKSTMIANLMKRYKQSICIHPTEMSKRLFCERFNISKHRVFTASVLADISKLKGLPKRKVYIDEVGICLQMLLRDNIIELGTHTDQ